MSRANVQSVAKDVAILSIGLLVSGIILEVRTGSIPELGRYALGCTTVLVSSGLMYPRSGGSHTLYDSQRLKAYVVTAVGIYFFITAVPWG